MAGVLHIESLQTIRKKKEKKSFHSFDGSAWRPHQGMNGVNGAAAAAVDNGDTVNIDGRDSDTKRNEKIVSRGQLKRVKHERVSALFKSIHLS